MPRQKKNIHTPASKRQHPVFLTLRLLFLITGTLLVLSCKTTTRILEATPEQHVVKKVEKQQSKLSFGRCTYKEKIVVEDTINHKIRAKEMNYYDCRGAYTSLIKSKKWIVENDRLRRQR